MQSTLSSVQVQDRSRDEVPFGCGEGLPSMLGRGLGMFVSLPQCPREKFIHARRGTFALVHFGYVADYTVLAMCVRFSLKSVKRTYMYRY